MDREDYNLKDNSKFFLGYSYTTRIVPYKTEEISNVSEVTEITPISNKAETYLRKCIELCKRQGIEIFVLYHDQNNYHSQYSL